MQALTAAMSTLGGKYLTGLHDLCLASRAVRDVRRRAGMEPRGARGMRGAADPKRGYSTFSGEGCCTPHGADGGRHVEAECRESLWRTFRVALR